MASPFQATSSCDPQVRRPFHRLTVALPKERLDVLLEADRLVGCGQVTSSLSDTHARTSSRYQGPGENLGSVRFFFGRPLGRWDRFDALVRYRLSAFDRQ